MTEALNNLDKILKSSNDLEKLQFTIKNIKKELYKEKQEYKQNIMQILYNLNQNQTKIVNIKNDKKQYEDVHSKNIALLDSFSDYVKDYSKIEYISISYKNFCKVRDLSTKLNTLESDIQEIKNKYKKKNDAYVFDFKYFLSCDSLLEIHQTCFNFEEFKYELLFYSKDVDKEAFFLVQRKINTIDQILVDFLVFFTKLGIDYTESLKNVLYAVNVVLQLEEERDSKTKKAKEGKNSDNLILKEICKENYRYIDRDEKCLKKKLEDSIKNDVKNKFAKIKSGEESFEFIFEDLRTIKGFIDETQEMRMAKKVNTNKSTKNGNVVHKSNITDDVGDENTMDTFDEDVSTENKSINILQSDISNNIKDTNNLEASLQNLNINTSIDWTSIIFTYHKELRNVMNDKVFKSNDILYILDFTKKYYEFLEAVMKVPKESLGDEILGDKENELIQEYTKCATSSLSAWVDNLKNNEIESFFAREASPTLDEEDKYTSLNFINLLQLIKQQLEPIAYNHKIFKVIINEITVCVRQFSKEIVKAMDKDFIPACKQKCNPGYEEYVIMFGNSGLKVTQYVSSLPLAQTSEVKELGNIFINITKKSNYYLSSFVINTCKPVIDKIFTNEWYTDDITKVLVVTVDDFLIDYQTNMSDFSFITFVYELCSELTKAYLKQLVRKRAKIYEDCGYKLNKDLGKFIDLFNKYGEKDEVESNLEAFKRIIPLLGRCNEEMFVVEFKAFLTVYPDIKKEYIKNIVYKKEEMDEESKKRLWVKVKECFKEIANIRTTMFSKL